MTGQVSIPSGIRVQCFQSSDCASDTKDGEIMTTEANYNPCCIETSVDYSDYYDYPSRYDSDDLLRDNPSEISFRLNDGECRPCNREFLRL